MKSLQILAVAALLAILAPAVHAASTADASEDDGVALGVLAHADDFAADSLTEPDEARTPNLPVGTTADDAASAGAVPGTGSTSTKPSARERTRGPSWQSLLPGSIQ